MYAIFGGFLLFAELEILTRLKILKLDSFYKKITGKGWLLIALATIINAFLAYFILIIIGPYLKGEGFMIPMMRPF
jgi:hypothetical protein